MIDREKLNYDLAVQFAGACMSQADDFEDPIDLRALNAVRAFCEAYNAFGNITDEYIASILEE